MQKNTVLKSCLEYCKDKSCVYIYGNGYTGKFVNNFLVKNNIKVTSYVVSDEYLKQKNNDCKNCVSFNFFVQNYTQDIGLIIAVTEEYLQEVMQNIDGKVNNYFITCLFRRNIKQLNSTYYNNYKELDDLGKNFKTDKSSISHNYLNKYEHFFQKFRKEKIRLLELGVFGGSSMKLWSSYFYLAEIYGVDINESCKEYETDRTHIIIKDLSDIQSLESLKVIEPTIIIDDASHIWSHQINALYELFDCLVSGGIYIVEDIETSFLPERYEEKYNDIEISAYEFLNMIAKRVTSGMPFSHITKYSKWASKIADLSETITFLDGCCIIVKK